MKNPLNTGIFKVLKEDLNFLLTNRIPRAAVTRFIGWYSKIRSPVLTHISLMVWGLFTRIDLSDSKKKRFESLHDCFIRELQPDSRPIDMRQSALVSPCDGIIGEYGQVDSGRLYQAKGFPYTLEDLLIDSGLVRKWADSRFITIRITSAMYHRFHAPYDGELERVRYISGDTWNVNPIALRRIESLFCKNERAVLEMNIPSLGVSLLLVPVAAILVASIRIHGVNMTLNRLTKKGLSLACSQQYAKGQELGWFEHGSTIILFAPKELDFDFGIQTGKAIRMGQAVLHTGRGANQL